MSIYTGPVTDVLAAATPATTTTALDTFKALGNRIDLRVTTVTGGAGTLTITAETGDDDSTYYQVIDRDSAWSMASSVIDTAGTYTLPLEGLSVTPGTYVRLSYSCTNAAGTIAITAVNWEDPAGGGAEVSVGDVVADLDTVNTNTAACATSLAVMDDWDESDRAKVNLIASQAGITGGAGAVAANTPRTTLASDDPAVTALQVMDDWDESDRAKVNPIAGQAGIAANAGAMDALTTRVTVATDDTHFGSVGAAADVDGVVHGQLRYAGETLATIDADTSALAGAVGTHDGAAGSTGVQLVADARSALPSAVATTDAVKLIADLYGRLMIAGYDLTSGTVGTTEGNPLSDQYAATSIISNEAVAADPGASYAPSSTGQAWGGYGPLSLQIYLLGGVKTGPTNTTVTLTIEATNGATISSSTVWVDITESFKSLLTGADSAANYTSTGATAYHDVLTLRREDANFTHFRVKYDWDDDPDSTNGIIVVKARGCAL